MKILVLCTGNSCRSQILHAYLEHYLGSRADVYSAGFETHGVNPNAIQVLKEEGIDISHYQSNHINEYLDMDFDYIITVCDHAKENCPYIPSQAIRLHHNFHDPSKTKATFTEILNDFRKTRDEIKRYCLNFIQKYQL